VRTTQLAAAAPASRLPQLGDQIAEDPVTVLVLAATIPIISLLSNASLPPLVPQPIRPQALASTTTLLLLVKPLQVAQPVSPRLNSTTRLVVWADFLPVVAPVDLSFRVAQPLVLLRSSALFLMFVTLVGPLPPKHVLVPNQSVLLASRTQSAPQPQNVLLKAKLVLQHVKPTTMVP